MVIREAVYNGALHGRPQRIQVKLVYTRDELSSIVSVPARGTTVSFSVRRSHLQSPAAQDSMQL